MTYFLEQTKLDMNCEFRGCTHKIKKGDWTVVHIYETKRKRWNRDVLCPECGLSLLKDKLEYYIALVQHLESKRKVLEIERVEAL